VSIVITVAVPPCPVFLLLFGTQAAEVSVFIAMILSGPPMIVVNLHVVPIVIIAVVWVVDSIVTMFGTSRPENRSYQCSGQQD
jgi:hypothetical protein